jgi:hypothetical protein
LPRLVLLVERYTTTNTHTLRIFVYQETVLVALATFLARLLLSSSLFPHSSLPSICSHSCWAYPGSEIYFQSTKYTEEYHSVCPRWN